MEYLINIEFCTKADIGDDFENYIQKITGHIIATDFSTHPEKKREIGTIELVYMDIESARDDGLPLFTLFDIQELPGEYCLPLYDISTSEWNKELLEFYDDEVFDPNILIIHRIKIIPEFRGKNIGLLVLRRSIQRFGHGCGVICLIAKPYQIELEEQRSSKEYKKFALELFEQNSEKASTNLKKHYQKLGFKDFPDSNLMVLNTAFSIPRMSSLGGKEHSYIEN